MKKISELEMLKDCLENRSPMLYLGAGFSLNSINKSGEALESAAGLCKLLYQRFWGKDSLRYQKDATDYMNNGDLKNLCQLLHGLDLLKERDNLLTEYFSGCHIAPDDSRNFICDYPWSVIFTVNIDDLIENIYKSCSKKLNVWNRHNDAKKHFNGYTSLVKLHGCVNNPSEGYIFDDDEYTSFMSKDDYILSEFGDAYSKNDIIFLGTEFNEDDISYIITKYEDKGYDATYANQFYFVSPHINSAKLQLKIESHSNMHFIKMTAIEFFDYLNEKITCTNEIYNKLKENDIINVYEIYNTISSNYSSKLYSGNDISYADLKYNWDINMCSPNLINWIKSDDHNKIISFYGKEYVGKTCIAKRLLYNLFIQDYDCFEFNLNSTNRIELFLEYVKNHCVKPVAVLFEGASYSYELLVQNIINTNVYNNRMILITTDNEISHNRKYYSLLKNDYCKIVKVDENVDKEKAKLIYDKLHEKNSLSCWLDVSGDKNIIIQKMIESNDIIDVIYFSSKGRMFEEHIRSHFLSDITGNNSSKKLIALFCLFEKFGISDVPKFLYNTSAKLISSNFKDNNFEETFRKLIQIQPQYYHMRYMRYLSHIYNDCLSIDEIIAIIKKAVALYAGRFNEGEYNEYSSILYKFMNIKSLSKVLSYSKIKELYSLLEINCKQYSYYWVQRGLCAQRQKKPDYEEADRYLREARAINPYSYQVAHAIAKNLINRGLENLNTYKAYYEEGIDQLVELLEGEKFNRAYGYSLHSYIDSVLKYNVATHTVLSNEECKLINLYVQRLDTSDIGEVLSNMLYKLKIYARNNNLVQMMPDVENGYWIKNITNSDDIDESIDID